MHDHDRKDNMLADTLKSIAGQRLVDTDGEVTHLQLLPPATEQQIRALGAKVRCPPAPPRARPREGRTYVFEKPTPPPCNGGGFSSPATIRLSSRTRRRR